MIYKRREFMPYQINDHCMSCGLCAEECPAEAISEEGGKYVIDEEKCMDCGKCSENCPFGAPQTKE
jgi:ferredoxin